MKLWIGVTDLAWFEQLAAMAPDEVNFWQPGARSFRVLQPGEPFLFKLHSPNNFVAGGGFFVRNSALPASLAWDAFGKKNGVRSMDELVSRIRHYRPSDRSIDPLIGCNVLSEPFFLPRDKWIPIPSTFALNIVSGKHYESNSMEGAELWRQVRAAMPSAVVAEPSLPLSEIDTDRRLGDAYLTRGRLGQGAFRVLVTEAYQRRCAVTGEKTLPVLEAAHIKPFAELGPHRVCNGILLRSDLHKLFDLGYVTVTRDLRLEVSPRLREEWHNGRIYYDYHGKQLPYVPTEPHSRPDMGFLDWHNLNRFRG